jgi:hypothetical protein
VHDSILECEQNVKKKLDPTINPISNHTTHDLFSNGGVLGEYVGDAFDPKRVYNFFRIALFCDEMIDSESDDDDELIRVDRDRPIEEWLVRERQVVAELSKQLPEVSLCVCS